MADPLPVRLVRIRDILADLDRFAPALWDDAPSFAMAAPLTEPEVAQAERRLGVSLPEEYRGFLLEVGSAGPGPDYGLAGPQAWPMPDELPQVTVPMTTVDGATFTAGTLANGSVGRTDRAGGPRGVAALSGAAGWGAGPGRPPRR